MTELDVTLPDGRTLHVHDEGDPHGHAVVVQHGTPACGRLHPSDVDDARTRGIRLIGFDRAGYGGSSANPGRSFAAAAGDVAALLDALGADRFATWGHSGGGPHALEWGSRTSRSSTCCSTIPRSLSRPFCGPSSSTSPPARTGSGRRC